jgi:hypothetical protein
VGLGDLEEPDQLEPVQALGAGLVLVDLWQPGIDGRVGRDETVDMGEPEEPADSVHHRIDRGRHQTVLAEVSDEQLDVGTLNPDQGVEPVGFAPGEPAAQLVGVQLVRVAGVPGQVGDSRQLGRRHRVRLERQQDGVRHGMLPATWRACLSRGSPHAR